MATVARSKQTGQRRLKVLYMDRGWGAIRITDAHGEAKDYSVTEVETAEGQWESYQMDGPDATYTTSLGRDGWSCTCPGFTHRKVCRHCDALGTLRAMGRI